MRNWEIVNYKGQVTHSTNLEGLYSLFNNYNSDLETSCSIRGSIDRGIDIVFEVDWKEAKYTDFDMDAGKDFGYDEIRGSLENLRPEKIIFSDFYLKMLENAETEEEIELYNFCEENALFQLIQK